MNYEGMPQEPALVAEEHTEQEVSIGTESSEVKEDQLSTESINEVIEKVDQFKEKLLAANLDPGLIAELDAIRTNIDELDVAEQTPMELTPEDKEHIDQLIAENDEKIAESREKITMLLTNIETLEQKLLEKREHEPLVPRLRRLFVAISSLGDHSVEDSNKIEQATKLRAAQWYLQNIESLYEQSREAYQRIIDDVNSFSELNTPQDNAGQEVNLTPLDDVRARLDFLSEGPSIKIGLKKGTNPSPDKAIELEEEQAAWERLSPEQQETVYKYRYAKRMALATIDISISDGRETTTTAEMSANSNRIWIQKDWVRSWHNARQKVVDAGAEDYIRMLDAHLRDTDHARSSTQLTRWGYGAAKTDTYGVPDGYPRGTDATLEKLYEIGERNGWEVNDGYKKEIAEFLPGTLYPVSSV